MSHYPVEIFDFSRMTAEDIQKTLETYRIALKPHEALLLQEEILKRPPSLAECILWSIQGSEHCSYKSSRHYLKTLTTTGPRVIIGAKEDAGIIAIATDLQGKRYGLVISHESHNHPSQIVPFEGAATGVGGNVRDVLCMGAEVIAVADDLRFGDVHRPHTQWIQAGVIAGIAGYGNPLGIPNIAGGLSYDPAYNDNCLVTVVTLGIVAEDEIIHSYAPQNAEGYDFILIGKPTDNSGFGGASFSSLELDEDQKEQNKGAVQEPNAFLERHLLKSSYALFKILKDKKLLDKVGFKDLGAGGIACASVELAEAAGYGADIQLDAAHVGMQNLNPSVILCSETQERFMWVAHPDVTPLILKHYNETFALPSVSAGAGASVIGKVTKDPHYIVRFQGQVIVDALAADVVKGIVFDRPIAKPDRQCQEPSLTEPSDLSAILKQVLTHENVKSRDFVTENYDKQVQGRVIIERGDSDAGVIQPFNSSEYPLEIQTTGVALSVGQNPRYTQIDPYWGTVNAVILAIMRLAAVGAAPQALTDCLCFGNPEKPQQMFDFVESIKALKFVSDGYQMQGLEQKGLPIVAGNVSLYNESKHGAIPASPMISAVGVMPDASKAIDMHFKAAGNLILLVGKRLDECGGSIYYQVRGVLGASLPKPDLGLVNKQIDTLVMAIDQGLVLSAKAIAEGGLAAVVVAMSRKNRLGVDLDVQSGLSVDRFLFTETPGFVLEINPRQLEAVKTLFVKSQLSVEVMGKTVKEPRFVCGELAVILS